MYSSGDVVVGDHRRRQVESEWDKLKLASEAFCAARPELRDINVNLISSGAVPPQRQHGDFMEEIAAFIRANRQELKTDDTEYWPPSFSAPLMSTYLQALYRRVDPFAHWNSNLTAGFVATATTSTIPGTVTDKSRRKFAQPTSYGSPFNVALGYPKRCCPSTRQILAAWVLSIMADSRGCLS
jgi:hypothetical protein